MRAKSGAVIYKENVVPPELDARRSGRAYLSLSMRFFLFFACLLSALTVGQPLNTQTVLGPTQI
ncbi:MAG: hypothetical protein M3Z32_09800, partial [Acidobacteriota bacterium]|nr:hypothetical protein [Acidobacteriota bacterium]